MRHTASWAIMLGLGLAAAAAGADPAPTPPAAPRECLPAPSPLEPVGADPVAQSLRHYVRGRLLMMNQEAVLASEEFRQAAALQPDVHCIWLNLGLTRYDAGNVTGAVEALDRALKLQPQDPATLYFRARIAATQGDLALAADLYGRLTSTAKKGSPYQILGTYHLARVRYNLADVPGAVVAYEALLDLLATPQSFFQRYPELYLVYRSQVKLKEMLARMVLQQGDADKAVRLIAEGLAERPDSTDLLDLMCVAYLQKKDFAAARTWAHKLIETQPRGAAGYDRLVEAYKAQGQPDAVVADLEALHRDSPDNPMAAAKLAAAYEAAGRKAEAMALYEALKDEPGQSSEAVVKAALQAAETYIQNNQPVEAIERLGAAIHGEVMDSAILLRAARLMDSLSNPDEVYRSAQRLVTADQKNYGTFVLTGMLAEVAKQPDDAITLYDRALAIQPRTAIAYSRKADLLIAADRYEPALEVYLAARAAGLDLPVFRRRMGMILERLDRLDDAIAEYRVARQAAPQDKTTGYLLASALARRGQLDAAEDELKALLARFPGEVLAYCQLGGLRLARNNTAGAEEALNKALALAPDDAGAKVLLGEVRLQQKRFDEAERLAREVIAARPEDHDVHLLLAYALAGRKQHPEAVAEVRALLATDPEHIGWRYLLAGLYAEMGDPASAERELQQILTRKPDHPPSNNDLGYMWADRGVNLDRAEQMIRQALKAEPQSPAYLDSLGWVLYKQGRFEDAAKALQEATRLAPDLDAVLWDHLGDTYWQLNRRQDAFKSWQAAAKILEARGEDAKADDVRRVQDKVRQFQAGATPQVAPLAPKETPDRNQAKP